jgi:hypothetical protein
MFYMFVCFVCNIVEWTGVLEFYHQDNLYLFVHMRNYWGNCVRLVHPRSWLKNPVANCFATDRSKAIHPMVLFIVNCLWCLIWYWFSYKLMLFFPLYFLAARGGCFPICGSSLCAYFFCFHNKAVVVVVVVVYKVNLTLLTFWK